MRGRSVVSFGCQRTVLCVRRASHTLSTNVGPNTLVIGIEHVRVRFQIRSGHVRLGRAAASQERRPWLIRTGRGW
jgi:hypothetical protein